MKAILIARVSTEEQKEAGNSLPAQVAPLEKYCPGKDFPSLKVLVLMKVIKKRISFYYYQNRFLAKALPDQDFKYFSNLIACD